MINNCAYTNNLFVSEIKYPIKTIIECGSRDCNDAIIMRDFYKSDKIYSFECNPESICVCEKNIFNIDGIYLVKTAVGDINGFVDFYATDMDKSIDKNIGASSMLYHRDNKTEFFQKKISVPVIRLDDFMETEKISHIDLLCLDLQGYEKIALEGLGNRINDIKYIITEASFKSYYIGDILFDEFVNYMSSKNFSFVNSLDYGGFGDVLFKNNNI